MWLILIPEKSEQMWARFVSKVVFRQSLINGQITSCEQQQLWMLINNAFIWVSSRILGATVESEKSKLLV